MEEVSHKLGLFNFIDSLEQLGVHLVLEVFVDVNLEVSFEQGLFSDSEVSHVMIHAHRFNLRLHLRFSFGLKLGSFSPQKAKCQQ